MAGSSELYDLLILVDATYSMSSYLDSLRTTLPQVISISKLTSCFSRIGLLAYKDYCDKELLTWSGWLSEESNGDVDLLKSARELYPMGGGDGPEATKTGLARTYELMRADATTIILLYTDAPPHTLANGSLADKSSNLGPERAALSKKDAYGGFGPAFVDWVSAAKTLRHGEKKAQVFSVLDKDMAFAYAGFYNYLSAVTGGASFYLNDSRPTSISKVTVEVLLGWMGAEKAGADAGVEFPAFLTRYLNIDNIRKLKDENDPAASPYFLTPDTQNMPADLTNITQVRLSSEILKRHLPKKATSVQDFAKRYAGGDAGYQKTAIAQLRAIIQDDVTAISLNPVFGSLWRAVCNDRENEAREELITTFGLQIDRIGNDDEKARMKIWLEESYDYTAEVLEAISSVPEAQRFPCVCLDPTLLFTREAADNEGEPSDDKAISAFTRDELLEIGRSCDYRILRRLGRVLTRLTYINSAEEMPAHISATPESEIPRIPMALATKEHKRKFWRILLHIVVPGTMLSARPAALLAALSIRMGFQPLMDAAEQEMLIWRGRWNDIEVPENWNVGCLSLLLDADEMYRKRHHEKTASLLKTDDRALFERLVAYKMLELNLDTTLTARIGWTPEKTTAPLGPFVTCRACKLPRSVTIMGTGGKCGHCLWTEYSSPEDRAEHVNARVTKDDNESTPAVWVECNVRTCRAQYVVYMPEKLNVRPKCFYCREGEQEAPTVECVDCLNKIVYPLAYRAKDMKDFRCYACLDCKKTVIDVETTANKLSKENGTEWLLRNENNKIPEPFNKRSLFHNMSAAGIQDFCARVELLPEAARKDLRLHGKSVRNSPDLIVELESWITRRRTESGTCSLCFSNFRKSDLNLACGRSGCAQKVCRDCLQGWYGLNAAGRIINTSALSCPFCRRAPAGRTLAKYGMGIHAVGNLKNAVDQKGEWVYAWCGICGDAKQYLERVCAAGAPDELNDFTCESCKFDPKDAGKVQMCPGCGVATQKSSGCNHIECSCGQHWCWYCGEKSTVGDIYGHMETEHGGFYAGNDGEDDESGYDTDY